MISIEYLHKGEKWRVEDLSQLLKYVPGLTPEEMDKFQTFCEAREDVAMTGWLLIKSRCGIRLAHPGPMTEETAASLFGIPAADISMYADFVRDDWERLRRK